MMLLDDPLADTRQVGMHLVSLFFLSIQMAKVAKFRTKNSTSHSHLRLTTRALQRHPLAANAGLDMPVPWKNWLKCFPKPSKQLRVVFAQCWTRILMDRKESMVAVRLL
jgi:hypothetical protein